LLIHTKPVNQNLPSDMTIQRTPEFLAGGGEMGERIRNFDWASTPLGPAESWPKSLRTCVQIMLTSRQPIWIGWGKELIKLYNDPYKAIVKGKHPTALGKPASVVWAEIWQDIEPMLKKVMNRNEGTYVEEQLLIMERNGYPEETYYTFSYTPVAGDMGNTEGMICFNSDDTERIISERHLSSLTKLSKALVDAKTDEDVFREAVRSVQQNQYDFPFANIYRLTGSRAILVETGLYDKASSKLPKDILISGDDEFSTIVRKSLENRSVEIFEKVLSSFGEMPKGAWNVIPEKAIILPIAQRGQRDAYGVLVVGANPYQLLNDRYLGFFNLVSDQIATSLLNFHALDEERKRVEALAEIDKAKTIFFSNISHEFRTPLTLLLGPIEDLLNDKTLDDEKQAKAQVAYRNAHRMQKLVNLLLDYSKIEAGRMEANFTAVDITSITRDLTSNFRSAVEKAGMELVFESDLISTALMIDIDMWEKIILNLLSNAFKYSEKGVIKVSIKEHSNSIAVSVSDTGIGIPVEELENIFKRFHRVQSTSGRSQEGTGIGLAMVKELVKLQNGHIAVKSQPGEGSTFTITLPKPDRQIKDGVSRHTRSHASHAYVEEATQWINAPHTNGTVKLPDAARKHTILLADDNADMRSYIQRLLEPHYEMLIAKDGEQAFSLALQHTPDLILSDIMMPKLDGFGLLSKLKSTLTTRNIPLIFLSARAGEEAKIEGLNAGANDYLVKPFSSRELIARVANHITTAEVRRKTEKQFYNLFLQSPAHIHVFRGPDHEVEFFHPLGIQVIGRDITGMKIREALPEFAGQGFFEMLDSVYHERKTIHLKDSKAVFSNPDGSTRELFFDITYLPWLGIDGNVQGILQFTFEVTETIGQRMKAESMEKKYRSIAQQAPVAMSVLRGPNHIVDVANDKLLEMWGKTYPEVIGKSVLDIFPELIDQGFDKILRKVYETGEPFLANEIEVKFVRNGEPSQIIVNLLYEPLRNENNEIEGIVAAGTDITEQVESRKKVAEAELKFRTIIEQTPSPLCIFKGEEMRLEVANDAALAVWHASRDVIGKTLVEIVPEMGRQIFLDLMLDVYHNGVNRFGFEAPAYFIRENGEREDRFFNFSYVPFRDNDKILGVLVIASDVTEQVIARKQLLENEERFRLLANTIPQIVWTANASGTTDYLSEQWQTYTGQTQEEGVANFGALIHPEDASTIGAKWHQALVAAEPWEAEYRLKNLVSGKYRWFFGRCQPLKDADGRVIKWVGSASDIHEFKEQSNWLEAQVQERTKALKELNQSLKISNEDLQQFAHVASHDLKEPIRKIKTFGNRLVDDYSNLLPEKGKSFLNKILSATDRMYAMVEGVLSYSTMSAAEQASEPVDLNEVLRNIQTDLEVLITEKDATITFDKLPVIEGAPVLLYQLFYNLINNSIKFSKQNEPVLINITSSVASVEGNKFAKIVVTDNGIGFDQEQAESIFTTFTRLNSKDKYEGTGLGLALCKKIVQRHSGFISASGESGKGASFTILLPIK
jgi:PAS domain S-box-containing protein